jgi:hypothetical protein
VSKAEVSTQAHEREFKRVILQFALAFQVQFVQVCGLDTQR